MSSQSLETRQSFAQNILQFQGDISQLQEAFQQAPGQEGDKKSIIEQSFRDVLKELILKSDKSSQSVSSFIDLVLLAVKCAEIGICYHSVPFLLLSDVFDCITLDLCENLFDVIENQVSTWTDPAFFSSGKILLLRMCNDLLRRLSSSQNTVFCGRIQLFLARLFPLSEKSALNLMSHFNLENVTTFSKHSDTETKQKQSNEEEGEEEMETDEGDRADILASQRPVDYNLYQKLWSLQDFFRQPSQCFNSERWKSFTSNVHEVLRAFSSYKLEYVHKTKRTINDKKPRLESMETSLSSFASSHYFAKYLTSEKLVNLQLSDSHFRRHVLIQILILFQYLTGGVKFKNQSQVLTDSQALWLGDTKDVVYKLLEETPPDGGQFADYITHALKREEYWIKWKNEGCPSYEKIPAPVPKKTEQIRLGDKIRNAEDKDLGSIELSRLWNLCPDNLEACTSTERIFVPALDVFLGDAIEEAKPDSKIPKESKSINNPNYSWQALRLLSRESPHFFPYSNQAQIRPLDEYLESVVLATAKDFENGGEMK